MSISAVFSDNIGWTGRRATIRTIANYVLANAPGHAKLSSVFSTEQQELRDAIGGWYFGDLSRDDLLILNKLLDSLQADLPAPISNWKEEWRPRFLSDFAKFRELLNCRIQELASAQQ